MHGNSDRDQGMRASIIMIEAPCKSFTSADRQIELELVARACRRIGPDGMAAVIKGGVSVRCRENTRGAVEEPGELGKSDRVMVIKAARRMTSPQEPCKRRDGVWFRGRILAQIDFFSGPARPLCWQRRNDARMRINSAYWISVPPLRAPRVEQKIVKVPKSEAVAPLGQPKIIFVSTAGLEKDLAIEKQGEKPGSWKTIQTAQLFHLLRSG